MSQEPSPRESQSEVAFAPSQVKFLYDKQGFPESEAGFRIPSASPSTTCRAMTVPVEESEMVLGGQNLALHRNNAKSKVGTDMSTFPSRVVSQMKVIETSSSRMNISSQFDNNQKGQGNSTKARSLPVSIPENVRLDIQQQFRNIMEKLVKVESNLSGMGIKFNNKPSMMKLDKQNAKIPDIYAPTLQPQQNETSQQIQSKSNQERKLSSGMSGYVMNAGNNPSGVSMKFNTQPYTIEPVYPEQQQQQYGNVENNQSGMGFNYSPSIGNQQPDPSSIKNNQSAMTQPQEQQLMNLSNMGIRSNQSAMVQEQDNSQVSFNPNYKQERKLSSGMSGKF